VTIGSNTVPRLTAEQCILASCCFVHNHINCVLSAFIRRRFGFEDIQVQVSVIHAYKVFCLSSGKPDTNRFVPLPISMFLLGNQFSDFLQSMAFSSFPTFSATTSVFRNIRKQMCVTSFTLSYRMCTSGLSL